MAKIILIDGVLNVKESYEEILSCILQSEWLELTDINSELNMIQRATGVKQDYRVLIQVKHIQLIKP